MVFTKNNLVALLICLIAVSAICFCIFVYPDRRAVDDLERQLDSIGGQQHQAVRDIESAGDYTDKTGRGIEEAKASTDRLSDGLDEWEAGIVTSQELIADSQRRIAECQAVIREVEEQGRED